MKFCQLIIISKNKHSITKIINTCIKDRNTILQFKKKKSRKKIVTVLKSPHVNKTAQEQFEEKLILNYINIRTHKINKFLTLFKKTFLNYYPEIKILINFKIQNSPSKIISKHLDFLKLNLNNYLSKVVNSNLFYSKNNKTKSFNETDRHQILLLTKNNLKQLEYYALQAK